MTENLQLATQTFQATKLGLLVVGKPTKNEWKEYGTSIKAVEGALQWVIGDWLNHGEKQYGETYAEAMSLWPESEYQTLALYKQVADAIQFTIRIVNVSWSHHREVAYLKLPEIVNGKMQWSRETDVKKISEFLSLAEKKKWPVRVLRIEVETYKRNKELEFALYNAPDKYDIFYADPPWKYADNLIEGYGAAEHHYKTMSIEELCNVPVRSRCNDNSVLFLWVTAPILGECWPVIKSWGFEYKASFVWDKDEHNYGHYNSVRHEFLLICTRGSFLPINKELEDSVQVVKRTSEHSRKPEEFRAIIDKMYPTGKRIELFARGDVPSPWEKWGNEA